MSAPPGFPQALVDLVDAIFPVLVRSHEAGSLAPHAAVCDADGQIIGSAFVGEESGIGVEQAIVRLEMQQMDEAQAGRIAAAAVFYHGAVAGDDVRPTGAACEANAIVAHVENREASFTVVIPYQHATSGAWDYLGPHIYLKARTVFIDIPRGGIS